MKTPEAAAPTEELLRVLRNLSQLPETTVFVISGRDQQTLDSWIGQTCPHVGLSAEHGSFLKWPGPGQKWLDLTRGVDFSWKEETTRIFEFYTERTPGSFIEMKKCSITWHYRLADPVYGYTRLLLISSPFFGSTVMNPFIFFFIQRLPGPGVQKSL